MKIKKKVSGKYFEIIIPVFQQFVLGWTICRKNLFFNKKIALQADFGHFIYDSF
jgi:hypothetical protein